MKWKDGSYYEGYWKGGKQHGKGMYQDANGRRQEGNWMEGTIVNRI